MKKNQEFVLLGFTCFKSVDKQKSKENASKIAEWFLSLE